jgi:hypothetical protein
VEDINKKGRVTLIALLIFVAIIILQYVIHSTMPYGDIKQDRRITDLEKRVTELEKKK